MSSPAFYWLFNSRCSRTKALLCWRIIRHSSWARSRRWSRDWSCDRRRGNIARDTRDTEPTTQKRRGRDVQPARLERGPVRRRQYLMARLRSLVDVWSPLILCPRPSAGLAAYLSLRASARFTQSSGVIFPNIHRPLNHARSACSACVQYRHIRSESVSLSVPLFDSPVC